MNSFTAQMNEILDAYDQKVQDVADQAIQRVAKATADRLKSTSPRKTGKYASGWKVKKNKKQDVVVYNTVYRLTHLLENGHVIRNKKGTYGRAPAHKHIAPAEEWAGNELQTEIERGLS